MNTINSSDFMWMLGPSGPIDGEVEEIGKGK
jgi:hypothetical protein